jgi:hypothetical protein
VPSWKSSIKAADSTPPRQNSPAKKPKARGVALMRALMDEVHFESRIGDGSSVVLEKRLRFLPNSPIQQMRPLGVLPASEVPPAPSLVLPERADPQAEPTA